MPGFMDAHALHGLDIGYVDTCLLASARLTPDGAPWMLDKRLATAATRLGAAADLLHEKQVFN